MCAYCYCGDWAFRHDPPWNPNSPPAFIPKSPFIPGPINPGPIIPWDLKKLKEYYELLLAIKSLEDQIGCPCEPNKADYLSLFKARVEQLEKEIPEKTKKK